LESIFLPFVIAGTMVGFSNLHAQEVPKVKVVPIAAEELHNKYLLDRGIVYDSNPTFIGILGGKISYKNFNLKGMYYAALSINSDLPAGKKEFLKVRDNEILFSLNYAKGGSGTELPH